MNCLVVSLFVKIISVTNSDFVREIKMFGQRNSILYGNCVLNAFGRKSVILSNCDTICILNFFFKIESKQITTFVVQRRNLFTHLLRHH